MGKSAERAIISCVYSRETDASMQLFTNVKSWCVNYVSSVCVTGGVNSDDRNILTDYNMLQKGYI